MRRCPANASPVSLQVVRALVKLRAAFVMLSPNKYASAGLSSARKMQACSNIFLHFTALWRIGCEVH